MACTKIRTSLIILWLLFLFSGLFTIANSQYDPICPNDVNGYVSGPGCTSYFICSNGEVVSPINQCQQGTLFNELLSVCDFEANVQCSTTPVPTFRPTKKPTVSPTTRLPPTTPSPTFPPQTRSPSANIAIEDALNYARHDIDNKLLLYQTAWNDWLPSTQYRYDGFMRALQIMYLEGINDMSFYLGEEVSGEEGTKIGLVNVAAFLAQSMKETIKYDSCDENNWDIIEGKYPLSNACGQLAQSYQDYTCPNGTEHMQCEVDPNMEITATTHATWYGAPGPLFCGPKTKYPYTGFWDYTYECDDPPENCNDYPGQKSGRFDNSEPVMNRANRTDVEGCCFWGRGVLQTTGICNFGMLNYFLGKRAADEGRVARYPTIDFCKDPGAICNRSEHPELKWLGGMFYWVTSLQPYENGWSYVDNLKEFVRTGMQDETFIDSVSGIVNRGCHNPPCGTGELDGGEERIENFKKALQVFFEFDGSLRVQTPSKMPSLLNTTVHEMTSDTPLGSNGAEGEEDDWSQLELNNAMNLWCGATISEANENCGRNGYRCPEGVCPMNDLKCFMLDDSCNDEKTDTNTPTPRPVVSAPSGEVSDTFFCGADRADASSSCHKRCQTGSPTECPNEMKCFGYVTGCSIDAAMQPPSLELTPIPDISELKTQNYCAKAKADLETGCFTAQTCNGDNDPPCPIGTYCWGNIVCNEANETPHPSPRPSLQLTQNPIVLVNGVCATNYDELQKTCWIAALCSNINPCTDGKKCFENIDCSLVSPKVPFQPSKDPTPLPTSNAETTNSVELYCAFSEGELGESCSGARSCVNKTCPLGMICFPFKCNTNESTSYELGAYIESDNNDLTSSIKDNSHELCPDFFVGWHTRADCKEYFECNNGQIGPLYTCGEGLKFDKVRGKCISESEVNQYCYGNSGASNNDDSEIKPNATVVKPKCTLGFTGWDAKPGCIQYFWCNNGHKEASHDCGENLLFDLELEVCNFADEVDCPYDLNLPTTYPTKSKEVTLAPSPTLTSESDEFVEFGGSWRTTTSPTNTRNGMPPWLNDIRITSNDGNAPAARAHYACCMMSLSAFYFQALT